MPQLKNNWEKRDFSPRLAIGSAAGILLGLAAVALALFFFVPSRLPAPPARDLTPAPAHSPLDETEFELGFDRERLDSAARQRLDTYGWVDRERGIARIPLTRAMEILATPSVPGGKR